MVMLDLAFVLTSFGRPDLSLYIETYFACLKQAETIFCKFRAITST